MKTDYFVIAVKNLTQRSKRSWLTVLGIFIGITAVVALVSLGQGFQNSILDQFSSISADKIFITPKGMHLGASSTEAGKLTTHDIDVIERAFGVVEAAGQIQRAAKISFKDEILTQYILGIPTDSTMDLVIETDGLEAIDGRMLRKSDKNKALAGYNVLNTKLFSKIPQLGNKVIINDEDFEIIGVNKKTGDPITDSAFFITEEDARRILNDADAYDMIVAKYAIGADANAVSDSINRAMRRDRNLKKGYEDSEVQTPAELIKTFNIIFAIVQVLIIGIAAISLIVGAVGIMNTMYTSVLERTQEIGVMKAVGARNSDIMQIFLIESGLLGLVGGLIGILLGVGIALAVQVIATQVLGQVLIKAEFSPYLIIGALLFSFIVGMASGALPARQASMMKPVDSLRYE